MGKRISDFLNRTILQPLESTGDSVLRTGSWLGDALYLLANSFAGLTDMAAPRGSYFGRILVQQLYFTAVQAFWIANLMGVALGVLTVLPLLNFGLNAVEMQATVMKVVLFQQLVPLLVALLVIGRSGTAVTAELGDMQTNAVIDSLLVMGIEPHRFLVLPRLIGLTLSLVLLTVWASLAAMAGGGLINYWQGGASFDRFLVACFGSMELHGIFLSVLMVCAFGVAISIVQCHHGLRSYSSPQIQGNLARAFVHSLLACVAITLLFEVARL